MFKTVAKDVWAFDVEWVPDADAGRRLHQLPQDLEEAEVLDAHHRDVKDDLRLVCGERGDGHCVRLERDSLLHPSTSRDGQVLVNHRSTAVFTS